MSELYKAIAVNNDELENLILTKAAKHLKLRDEKSKFDLYPFFCILVSTGTNKNTDHFDPVQLWRARHSPVDKPVNIGHKQTRIIGHMLDSIVVGEDLKPIPEDTDEGDLPYKLHLITSAVIYKIWEDPAVQAEVSQIVDKVAKGQIFVSMEALFRSFSYLLTHASTGEQKILPRNEKTSALTKYLRQYKGPGRIYDYSIARVLEDITFSAVGIVEQPANIDSIISASLDIFDQLNPTIASETENNQVYINLEHSTNGENIMSTETVKATDDGGGFNHDYKEENDSLKKENAHLHNLVAELNTKVTALEAASPKDGPEGKDQPKNTVERERDSTNPDKNYPNPAGTGKKKLKGPDKSTYASEESEDDTAMAENSASDQDAMKEMAELRSTVASLEVNVKTLTDKNVELATANDALSATVDAFKKASRHSDRAEAMMVADATLTREKALEAVKAFDELSDAGFTNMVAMMKGYASRAPKEVTAETVINSAKAEKDVPMGASAENEISKTVADIKNFLTRKTKNASSKE